MLNEPEVVNIGGKDYKVSGFTQLIQESFERYLQGYYLKVIKKNKDEIGQEYKEVLLDFFVQVEKGTYNFGGSKFIEFINQRKNFIELVWWCFSAYDNTITREFVADWIDKNEEEAVLMFERFSKGTILDKKKVETPETLVN